jgi:uncharacterized membrane protein
MGRLAMKIISVLIVIAALLWVMDILVDRQSQQEAQQKEILR